MRQPIDKKSHPLPGQDYNVIEPFTDYDSIVHGVGETGTYPGTHLFAYDDGITPHVLLNDKLVVYKFQWLTE